MLYYFILNKTFLKEVCMETAKREQKDQIIAIRLSKKELQQLKGKAEDLSISLSSLIRMLTMQSLKKALKN